MGPYLPSHVDQTNFKVVHCGPLRFGVWGTAVPHVSLLHAT
jgi:hypothetical protein